MSQKLEKTISSIDDYLLSLNVPNDFRENSENNAVRSLEVSHQKVLSVMEESGIRDPSRLSVFEFENKLDYLQSKKSKK